MLCSANRLLYSQLLECCLCCADLNLVYEPLRCWLHVFNACYKAISTVCRLLPTVLQFKTPPKVSHVLLSCWSSPTCLDARPSKSFSV